MSFAIRPAVFVAQQVWKHRKAIYSVISAQDKYISKSLKYGGYGKATSWGWRSGAAAGSLVGPLINDQVSELTNGSIQPVPTPRSVDKKRPGIQRYNGRKYKRYKSYYSYNRRQRYACRPKFRRKR